MPDETEAPISGRQFLARLYWMFLGNALVFLLLLIIFGKRLALPSPIDAAVLVVLVSLIIVRYIDIRSLNGQTADGKPATMAHWRRYALVTVPAGVGAWLLVRALTHFLR